MTDAYDTLREMLKNVPDDAQVYVEELESIVEWPGITAGTFRALLAEIAGFEWGWEQREKAHDAEVATLTAQLAEARKERDFYRLDAERHAQFADSYRAQLSSDKREALVPCRECAGSGLVPATPSGAGKCPMPDDVCEQCGYRCATPSGASENDQCACGDVAVRNWEGYAFCAKCCATPSPEAREVPEVVDLKVEVFLDGLDWESRFQGVRITPADAKRIVAMGLQGGMNALAQEAPDAAE